MDSDVFKSFCLMVLMNKKKTRKTFIEIRLIIMPKFIQDLLEKGQKNEGNRADKKRH